MLEIRTILAPTDFSRHSESALRYACALAERLGASIHLLHVLSEVMPLGPDPMLTPVLPPDFYRDSEASSNEIPANTAIEAKITHKLVGTSRDNRYYAEQAVVCVLARGVKVSLEQLDGSVLRAELARQLAPGFDRFPERQDEAMRALTAAGGWRLTLSEDAREALPFLLHMLNAT